MGDIRRWLPRVERIDTVVVFAAAAAIAVALAIWPVDARIVANLQTDRVSFVYQDPIRDALPGQTFVDDAFIKGIRRVRFSGVSDAVSTTARNRTLEALDDGATVTFLGSAGLEWMRLDPQARVLVTRTKDGGTVHLGISTEAAVTLGIVPSTPLTVECDGCREADSGEPPSHLVWNGLSASRIEIDVEQGFFLDVRVKEPFEWGPFAATDFDFTDDRPVGTHSTIRGRNVTVSDVGLREVTTVVNIGDPVRFDSAAPLWTRISASTAEMTLNVSGRVRSVTVGAQERSFVWIDRVLASRGWTAAVAGVLFGLGLLNVLDKLKLRFGRGPEGRES